MAVKFDFLQMISISDLHRKLSDISEKVSKQDVLVLKNNKPEFIIISPEKYEVLIDAAELVEQLDIYETIKTRREKSTVSGEQLLEKLLALKTATTVHE